SGGRGLVVRLLVQRLHRELRNRARARRVRARAQRIAVAERDRRGQAGALRLPERAGSAEAGVAPELRGGARVPGPAGALRRVGLRQSGGGPQCAGARRAAVRARAPHCPDAAGRPAHGRCAGWPRPGEGAHARRCGHGSGERRALRSLARLLAARRRRRSLQRYPLAERPAMAIRIGDEAPDFTAATTEGTIRFHEWVGDQWAILFSHPKDFTPVCTTELGYMASLKPEFDKRNCKIIGLSADPVSEHKNWAKDIQETQGHAPNYPIIGDADLTVAKLYDMLPASETPGKRTAADNQTVRSVFLIGPDKKVKAMLVYPMSTGRNFDEVLRLLDSLQLTAKHTVATPVNWKPGQDVIIPTSVSDEDAKKKYPQGYKTLKPYLRVVSQPNKASADAQDGAAR